MKLGLLPCKSDTDIWMQKNWDMYDYDAVYVDDLAIGMKDTKELIHFLQTVHGFKTKGSGPIGALGAYSFCDHYNTLCASHH
jgi:hypothetical protein